MEHVSSLSVLNMLIYWEKKIYDITETEVSFGDAGENSLEVNTKKTKYMIMFRQQNAWQNRNPVTTKIIWKCGKIQ